MNAARTLVIGDAHGAIRALDQVLERAGFQQGVDRVVFLGDVCDGWPDVIPCIQRLVEIGAECVWGNHDVWAADYLRTGVAQSLWTMQGGMATFLAFGAATGPQMAMVRNYLAALKDYIHDPPTNYLYVHGGIPVGGRLGSLPDREYLTWDRDLYKAVVLTSIGRAPDRGALTGFAKVFVGHTSTERFSTEPVSAGGVVLLDQGAGWGGKLSAMDADTGEFWQSDVVADLYPEHPGRRER
jgi:serine/threonine protein phosphatase 1